MESFFNLFFWLLINNIQQLPEISKVAVNWYQIIESSPKIQEKTKPQKFRPKKALKQGSKKSFTSKPVVLEDWKADIARYICTKDWDCKTAVAVAMAESGLNPDAKSPTNDHGVMQLNGKKIYNAQQNIDEAYEMYKRRGWQPWAAYNNGRYKKYLDLQTASGSIIQEGANE